jgi:phosphoserine phosphatase
MLRILLVRHGETEWNRVRRIMGREDIGLTETGRFQSLALKEALAHFPLDAVYSSPILRARETAMILTEERDLEPINDERLVEVNYGDWVGKTFSEVRELQGYTPYFKRLQTPVAPNGETLFQVRDRAMSFIHQLKQERHDQTVLAVSHADWIKCLLMEILEIPFANIWRFRIDNVSVSLFESDEAGDRIICVNQRGDLDRLFVTRFAF